MFAVALFLLCCVVVCKGTQKSVLVDSLQTLYNSVTKNSLDQARIFMAIREISALEENPDFARTALKVLSKYPLQNDDKQKNFYEQILSKIKK